MNKKYYGIEEALRELKQKCEEGNKDLELLNEDLQLEAIRDIDNEVFKPSLSNFPELRNEKLELSIRYLFESIIKENCSQALDEEFYNIHSAADHWIKHCYVSDDYRKIVPMRRNLYYYNFRSPEDYDNYAEQVKKYAYDNTKENGSGFYTTVLSEVGNEDILKDNLQRLFNIEGKSLIFDEHCNLINSTSEKENVKNIIVILRNLRSGDKQYILGQNKSEYFDFLVLEAYTKKILSIFPVDKIGLKLELKRTLRRIGIDVNLDKLPD